MAPSLRSSSSPSTSAAAAAAATSSSVAADKDTTVAVSSTSNSNISVGRMKQSEITIGSYVKTRQKNFTRYGQVVAGVVTGTTDEDGRHRRRPNNNNNNNTLWQVNLFPQQASSIVVQTKDLTQVENVDNIPDVFDVPCPGVLDSRTTILSNSDDGRRHRNGRRAGITAAEKNGEAKSSSSAVGRGGGGTDDINNNASDDDQVNRLAKTFVDRYDISSSESIMDTVKAGMRFCYESIQSTLRFPISSGPGVGSAVAAAAAAAAAGGATTTKTPTEAMTVAGSEKRKGVETETQEGRRSTKMARLIRDTECSLCCEEMTAAAHDEDGIDGGGGGDYGSPILATFPCGHALHVRCFMLWHDQNNNNSSSSKTKKGKKKQKNRQNISESVSCPTCLQGYPLGPDDGPFGH